MENQFIISNLKNQKFLKNEKSKYSHDIPEENMKTIHKDYKKHAVKFISLPDSDLPFSSKKILLIGIIKHFSLNFLTYVSYNLLHTLNIICLGHTNDLLHINAVQLGYVYMKFFGFNFCIGCLTAFDILAAEAHRDNNMDMLYKVYNQAKIFSILCFLIFILPLCFNCNYVLLFLGYGLELSEAAGVYVKISLFVMFVSLLNFINVKFLNLLKKQSIVVFINLITLGIHIISCVTFIIVFKLQELGAGLSMLVSGLFNFISLSYFLEKYNPCETKSVWDLDTDTLSSTKFYYYVKMAIPSGIFFNLFNSVKEMTIFANAYIDSASLAANLIYINLSSLFNTIILSTNGLFCQIIKACYHVKENKTRSKFMLKACLSIVFVISLSLLIPTYYFSDRIGFLFVKDQVTVDYSSILIKMFAIQFIFEWMINLFEGAIMAIDYKSDLSKFCCFFLILICLPLSLIFTFKLEYGYKGFVFISLISNGFLTVIYGLILSNKM